MQLLFVKNFFRWHRLIENQVVVSKQDLPVTGNEVVDFLNYSALSNAGINKPKVNGNELSDDPLNSSVKSTVIEPEQSRIEQVQVLTHPNLVTANEIVIEQPRILEHAKQMQTSMERLLKHDTTIINALVDKHNILSELLKEQNVSFCFFLIFNNLGQIF